MSRHKLFNMKKIFLLASFSLVLFSCQKSEKETAKTSDHAHQTSENKNEIVALMDKMMDKMHAPQFTGNNDADFANMMTEHHIGAVEMSELLLKEGQDEALKTFAQKVIDTQTKEIEEMKKLQNNSTKSADAKEFQQALNQSMGAMMNKEIKIYNNMDSNYAAQMIPHHQSAVEMAKAYLKFGRNVRLILLSNDIVKTQNAEITELQDWLDKK